MAKGSPIYNPDVQSDIDMKGHSIIGFSPGGNTKLIYVDAINGPYKTLAAAYAVASSGDEIALLSDLSDSGSVTITIPITIDGNNHKINSSIQTDSQKLVISANGVQIRNLEFNGLWDGSSTIASTGAVIQVNNKRCGLRDIYIHDTIDSGILINGDFTDTSVQRVKINNARLHGIYAQSGNTSIANGPDFGFLTLTNIGQKGLGVARTGAETNQVYGVNIHDIYYDNIGGGAAYEAMYIHGLIDFHICNVTGSGNVYNISLDTCVNGTLENCVTRGGLGAIQYSGLELAGCQKITVSNCVFDGLSRTGATSTASAYGGIQGSNLSQLVKAGQYTFNNVISVNWTGALSITLASGININGGIFSGTASGIHFAACDTVLVTGADISATASGIPISIDSGTGGAPPGTGITNKDYRIIGNFVNASAGSPAEIDFLSQDALHTLNGITVKNNIKRDSESITPAVKTTASGGGSISNITVFGNEPKALWNNDSIDLGIITSKVGYLGGSVDANWNQIELSHGNVGSAIMFNTVSGGTHQPIILGADDNLRFYGKSQTEKMRLQDGLAIGNTTDPGTGNAILNGSLRVGNTAAIHTSGAGSPNGVVTASVGSTYYRTDGGTGTTFYVKETGSGNTGWTGGVSTVGGGATIAATSTILAGDGSGNAIATTETGTGNTVRATGPTLTTPTIGVATATSINGLTITNSTGTITVPNGVTITAPEITTLLGFRNIPQNSKSANYTTVLNDSGKHLYHPASDANARTFTIDSNANVAYVIGTAITFVNLSANNVTISITSDTMYLSGAGTTGNRTLAQYGTATALKTGTTEWVIFGTNLT